MQPATSVGFATVARALAAEARRRGLRVPAFRSPPGLPDTDRTLRRQAGGGVVVAVRFRNRPLPAVVGDLVDGVVAANALSGQAADSARSALLSTVEGGDVAQPAEAGRLKRLQ